VTVIGLGAWCDYITEDEYRDGLSGSLPPEYVAEALEHFRRGGSFRVEEYAVLADGRRLTLNDDQSRTRGFSGIVSATRDGHLGSRSHDFWAYQTLAGIEADVRTTVLPDDNDTDEEHPWEWIAERLHAHGIDVSPEQLKRLPYEVEFSERLRARVQTP
jgi:hypothetical protein